MWEETTAVTAPPRALELLLLVALLLLAGVLRMGWPGLTEFKADEARLTMLALEMAQGDGLALRGISSSVGFPNFPMSVWLYALPLAVWPHVYAATLFTGLLNLLAVAGTYWFVRRYWGPYAALTAALLFTVNPWALHHARKIWAQNLLAPFIIGWGISGALAGVEKRANYWIPHFLCLAIAAQTHLAAMALVPVTALLLLFTPGPRPWRRILAGAGLAFLTLIPFLVYLWQSGTALPASAGGAGEGGGWGTHAFQFAWLLSAGSGIHALAGPQSFRAFLAGVPDETAVQLLWGALFLLGYGLLVRQLRRGNEARRRLSAFLLLWTAAPLLLFSLPQLPKALHYLLPVYPVPFIAAGIGAVWLGEQLTRRRRWAQPGRVALAGLILLAAAVQIWIWLSLLFFVRETATPGGFGIPLQRKLAAAAIVEQQMTAAQADEVLIIGAGDNPAEESFAAEYDMLLHAWPRRFVDGRETAVFPAANAVLFLAPEAKSAAELYAPFQIGPQTVPLRPGEGSYTIAVLPPTTPVPDFLFDPPHILTNWAAFAGVDAPESPAGRTANWRVYWYAGETSGSDFHLFNHLLDANGNRLAQADTAVFPAAQWQAGDLVITQVQMAWPAAGRAVRLGMYVYPSLEPVLVFDVAGNPTADGVTVPVGVGSRE
jgi:4-amino-4-deoxy-L-arabinose transferase-like glycosyltransferase